MILAQEQGYLLEVKAPLGADVTWYAWVSNPAREVVGYGAGLSRTEAIRAAVRAWNTARKPIEQALLAQASNSDPQPNQMAY
jgi:hypothetical protein